MKLILSSCDFLNENSKKCILNNINKPLDKCKVLFIPNEPYLINNLDKYYKRLESDGFKKEKSYILNENKIDEFRDLNIDLIYIGGGNTFYTLNKIKKNHFDKCIINYLKKGVIYIGGSCGAHIVTSNIEHVLSFDDNFVGIKDFDGLNLFKGIIIPHYDKSRKSIYKKLLNDGKYKVYPLTNDGSIVVNNNIITIYDNEIKE